MRAINIIIAAASSVFKIFAKVELQVPLVETRTTAIQTTTARRALLCLMLACAQFCLAMANPVPGIHMSTPAAVVPNVWHEAFVPMAIMDHSVRWVETAMEACTATAVIAEMEGLGTDALSMGIVNRPTIASLKNVLPNQPMVSPAPGVQLMSAPTLFAS